MNNEKIFLGKKLLIMTAHPDDESYMAAGTIYKNFKAGGWAVLVCATYGERGTSHLKKSTSREQLKEIRKRELAAAARVLGIAPVHILGLPDGQLSKNVRLMAERGAWYAARYKPQAILSFGPDGISGHRDHGSVGKAAAIVARQLHVPLVTATLPPAIAKKALAYLKTRRKAGHYQRTVTYQKPNVRILINSMIKRKALRCHASQLDGPNAFTGFPKFAVRELLQAEHFVVRENLRR